MRGVYRMEGHGADCRLVMYADTPEEILKLAARAVAQSGRVRARRRPAREQTELVTLDAPSLTSLLADWVNEVIALSEIHDSPMECTDAQIEQLPQGYRCQAELRACGNGWRPHLKAATLHNLTFEQRGHRWYAAVVCDL